MGHIMGRPAKKKIGKAGGVTGRARLKIGQSG
jgi:hypothetical protein